MAQRDEFDVCVIGTGAGGGVMVKELTQAGFSVVALERDTLHQRFLTKAVHYCGDARHARVREIGRRLAPCVF